MEENKKHYRPESIDVHFQVPVGIDTKFIDIPVIKGYSLPTKVKLKRVVNGEEKEYDLSKYIVKYKGE